MSRSTIVVVPEGLASDENGNPLRYPSFIYRQVLEDVAAKADKDDIIYLAPGNCFGGEIEEHLVAKEYLSKLTSCEVVSPSYGCQEYVDTRANASLLRKFFDENTNWPSSPICLFTASQHMRRSDLCFRKEGFTVVKKISVRCVILSEPVPRRLWYYKFPVFHRVYEALAFIRDSMRG